MKPSSELFDLIKSLSKSEKRFFKLSSSLQSGEKNYLKIFDVIEKQKEYNEETLKDAFAHEKFINHLPSEKNHLYKLILKSLRGFHSDNSVSSILKEEIKNVEILYKKALFKECGKFLRRAKKIAEAHEKFYYWFELLSWEKTLIEEDFEQGNFTIDLDKLIEEEKMVIEKLRNMAEYQMIFSRINYIFRSDGFVTKPEDVASVDSIANHHLILGKNTAISNSAAAMCYYIQGLCNATKRDYETAVTKFSKTKAILDKHYRIKQDVPQNYVRTLHNLIQCLIAINEFDRALELVEEMEGLIGTKSFKSYDIKVKVFSSAYTNRIAISYKQGAFQATLKIIDELIEGLSEYQHKLPKEQILIFNYNIGYVFFGAGLYRDSLKWINKILNDNESNLRQDIYGYTRLFNLIVHYELDNYDLLEYLMKSTTRQIKKNSNTEKIELAILKFLKRIIRMSDKAKKEEFIKFEKDLNELLDDYNQNAIQQYLNIHAWVRSKIDEVSFEEAVKSLQ